MIQSLLRAMFDIFQFLLFIIGCYYFTVAIFSFVNVNREQMPKRKHAFALVVAAHNEENVIGQLVKSLKELKYPDELYKIFVIADNCDDNTANEARAAGAEVFERFDLNHRGKGYAMEFAFEKLFGMDDQMEYICIFDADNIVDKDFLFHMNNKINEGYRAVQGYIDSKNPTASWLTFSYSLWYWINNRTAQLSRENLGLGCRLGGTGFAIATELIKEYGWGATCLAEDTEFTLKLALNDIRVGWEHKAVIYDEKPIKLDTSMRQRSRWMQGLADVASRYVGPLLEKGFKEKKMFPFHMLMNFWSDCLYPLTLAFFSFIYAANFVLDETSYIYRNMCEAWNEPMGMLLLSVFVWGNLALTIYGLYIDGKLNRGIAKNFFGFIIYILTWIPIGIVGFFKRNEKEWYHTPHSPNDNR